MHLADAFIQSDLQYIQAIHFFISMCVPWELNPHPFRWTPSFWLNICSYYSDLWTSMVRSLLNFVKQREAFVHHVIKVSHKNTFCSLWKRRLVIWVEYAFSELGVGGWFKNQVLRTSQYVWKQALGNNRVALTAVVYLHRPFAWIWTKDFLSDISAVL